MKELQIIIEKLIAYAKEQLDMSELDAVYTRNLLLNRLKVASPLEEPIDTSFVRDLEVPDPLIEELRGILEKRGDADIDLLIVEIMGLLTPMPSAVSEKVLALEKERSGAGLDYLHRLEIRNNYIQKTAIDRNIYFRKDYGDNFLEITINLSKPEKKNSDIAKLLTKQTKILYPKCLLCKENLGYQGRSDHPARGNIRIVPLTLSGERWFLQYSPYAYFDHHCIVINDQHQNMTISEATFRKLLEFVDIFPTFFVGSNADLPIVGGSILNHEHYQGGLHLLPVFYSKDRKVYYRNQEEKVSLLHWFNTVIRIEGKSIDAVCAHADRIFRTWKDYDDASADILAYSGDVRHSTITPIARKIGDIYQLNLILRNNRCTEEYPDGIFHAHPEYHHIKQEGIGLIEAMGLFILPPRLKRQTGYIEEILTGRDDAETYFEKYPDLDIHRKMIMELISRCGRGISAEEAHSAIQAYLAETCRSILCNTAVFKDDEKGRAALDRFMQKVGYEL